MALKPSLCVPPHHHRGCFPRSSPPLPLRPASSSSPSMSPATFQPSMASPTSTILARSFLRLSTSSPGASLSGTALTASITSLLPPTTTVLASTPWFIGVQAYASYMKGTLLFEQDQNWKVALMNFRKASLFGRKAVVSADPVFNRYIMQNEGKLFQSSYSKSFRDLVGKNGVIVVHGEQQKRLHAIAVNAMKLEKLNSNSSFLSDAEMIMLQTINSLPKNKVVVLQDVCRMVLQMFGPFTKIEPHKVYSCSVRESKEKVAHNRRELLRSHSSMEV